MATGPTGTYTSEDIKEMEYEGSRLAFELNRADGHIEKLEKQIKEMKDHLFDVECESAVFKAERDQADEKVLEQDKQILTLTQERDDLLEQVKDLKGKLQEWEDFEGWRQGRWVMVQDELKRLREEVASLKKRYEPVVDSS